MISLAVNDPAQRGSVVYLTLVCLVATLGGLLFGYDTAVIAGAIGFLQTNFELSAAMKGWAASSALVGCVAGAAVAGVLSDRIGRKKVLILSAVFFLTSAIGTAVPHSLTQFILFRIVGGIGVGAASMTSPLYIAEISPAHLRGRMVSVNQLAIVFGMVVVYFVNYFIAGYGDEVDKQLAATESWNVVSGWRWMFGSEAIPAVALLLLLFLVPESPRWLTKQDRVSEARNILTRVDGADHAQREMAEIAKALSHESATLSQLLMPGMRIALMIGIALAVLQQITGINVILYYGPEIFKKTGVESNVALLWTIIVGGCMTLFTLLAIWTVDRLGRKPLMIVGAVGMGACLLASGLAFYHQQAGAWVLAFILGYIAFFSLSVGPVTWVILSEIFPTKIRGRAMAFATICLWTANYVVSQTFPMMDENEWLIIRFNHGFPFFVYAGFCAVLALFIIVAVPETKNKTLEEVERLWIVDR